MIRNIGIIAHVDAGKTTTCERMLFYSGDSNMLGDVDKGDTVMDFLKLERERGITIQAAATSFPWQETFINIIDTPGHVDFTAEVERSVRVLDGAVTILDAVAGVQAQTETVWHQANKYKVPRIAFINKMDREGASLERSLETIEKRLRMMPVALQLPLGESKDFYGCVDIIHLEQIEFDEESYGRIILRSPLTGSWKDRALQARRELIDKLSLLDDELMEYIIQESLELDQVTSDTIYASLKRLTLALKIVPVLLGSSLKNKGVQPLLDHITTLLPSPLETQRIELLRKGNYETVQCDPKGPLLAQAFKVVHDQQLGHIVYIRIYRGTMTSGQRMRNSSKGTDERALRLMRVHANQFVDLKEAHAGDICALTGLKVTSTGDTLVAVKDEGMIDGIDIPEPVFFCSVTADSPSEEEHLQHSLDNLHREDPSFRWHKNKDTGQWQMSGMGELHLEILKDRLLNHYKCNASIGNIQIAYKSTIDGYIEESFSKEYMVNGKAEFVTCTVELEYTEGVTEFKIDESVYLGLPPIKKIRNELKEILTVAAEATMRSGQPAGFPFHNVTVTLNELRYDPNNTMNSYRLALMEAIGNAARKSGTLIMEPVMKMEIWLDDPYLGGVLSDLTSRRRGSVSQVSQMGHKKWIQCMAPLKELNDYSTEIRSLSKGSASYSVEFDHYGVLPQTLQTELLNELGYIDYS